MPSRLAIGGPGQSEPLRLHNIPTRHDYEAAGIPGCLVEIHDAGVPRIPRIDLAPRDARHADARVDRAAGIDWIVRRRVHAGGEGPGGAARPGGGRGCGAGRRIGLTIDAAIQDKVERVLAEPVLLQELSEGGLPVPSSPSPEASALFDLLGLMLGATVYTFSIILGVFLIGLGIGSAAGANKHAGSLTRIRHGNRLADTTAAAGDKRYLSV